MIRKILIAAAAALLLAATGAQAQTEIQCWHSMGGALGDKVNELANKFNASQNDYKVVPVYKGSYPESMTAAIAAYPRRQRAAHPAGLRGRHGDDDGRQGRRRAGLQAHEGRRRAVRSRRPTSARSRATTPTRKGNMLSFPFNSSTVVFYINKDAFKKAGSIPNKAPKTWKEFIAAAEKLKAAGPGVRLHDRLAVLDAHRELLARGTTCRSARRKTAWRASTPSSRSTRRCTCATSRCWATWRRRACSPTPGAPTRPRRSSRAASARCSPRRTGAQANIRRNAKFEWSVNFMPYYDDVKGAPQNSIIGGASLWVMGGKTNNAYKGVAKFFAFLSKPEVQMDWHTSTGLRADHHGRLRADARSPASTRRTRARTSPIKQLTNKPPTANSKGLRFGNFVQGREVIEEEMEAVFAGKKDAEGGARRGGEARQRDPAQVRGAPTSSGRRDESPKGGPRGRPSPCPWPMEKRVVFQSAWLPYAAGGAADRDHGGLLLLARGRRRSTTRSWCRTRSGCRSQFVWFQNFAELFSDSHYLASFRVTAVFSLAGGRPRASRISLLLAVMADRVVRGALVYKTLLIWPYAVAPGDRRRALGVPASPLDRHRRPTSCASIGIDWNWIINGDQAMLLVVIAAAWKQISYNFLFFLAGPAVDPEVADRGGGDRRRRARCGASGRSSSRCSRPPPSSCWW